MKITARDIAERCDTSLAAVSRAFRAEASIADDLRQKILNVSRELGYSPPVKRIRRAKETSKISIVVGDVTNPFFPHVLECFSKEIKNLQQDMVVHIVPPGATVDSVMLDVFQSGSDAAIITSANLSSKLAKQCKSRGIPVVLFNRVQIDPSTNAVCADNYNGARMIAQRFLSQGRDKLAFIGGIPDTSTHLERRRGLLDELALHDVQPIFERPANYDYATAFDVAMDLFLGSVCPTGIFCANDIMAIAAIDAAKRVGINVGQDVGIIGFDDIPMASWTSYQLTTVRQRVNMMVRASLEQIKDFYNNPDEQGSIRIIRGDLIERDSG